MNENEEELEPLLGTVYPTEEQVQAVIDRWQETLDLLADGPDCG